MTPEHLRLFCGYDGESGGQHIAAYNTVAISALLLHSAGNDVVLELEIEGHWYPIVACNMRGAFSHIAEPSDIRQRVQEGQHRAIH